MPATTLDRYLAALVERLRALLGDDLVAVALGNSAGLGALQPRASDVDVLVACRARLPDATKRELAAALSHAAVPTPARVTELVVYRRAALAAVERSPAFEVNLNTGPAIAEHVTYRREDEDPHWFLIDLAVAR